MDQQEIHLPFECPRCQVKGEIWRSISLKYGSVRFYSSFRCGYCGYAEEEDGVPFDDCVASAFYLRHGQWELRLVGLGPNRSAVIQKLRGLLNLDLASALGLSRRLPSVLVKGTRVQAEHLNRELGSVGAELELSRVQ